MFTKFATAGSALALLFASPAMADGLMSKDATTPADSYIARTAFQGFGIGINGGGQFTNIDITDGGFSFDGIGADGIVGGIHAEYLFAMGAFRVGPYLEGALSNVDVNISDTDLLNQDYYLGGGIKAGFIVGSDTLIYAKGGYEWSKWSVLDDAADVDVQSVLIGGGIETYLASHITLGVEASYVVPLNIEVESKDITHLLEESESLRVIGKITYRWN